MTAMVRDETLQSKLDKALAAQPSSGIEEDMSGGGDMKEEVMTPKKGKGKGNGKKMPENEMGVSGQVAQVVGIIIGSPEFQRK